MPGIQDLVGQQPQGAPQGQPPQQGNPLATLAASQQQQAPPPVPTRAQTVAAVHHFGQIKQAMNEVMEDPNLGKKNIRPKLLDAMSKLLGSKTLSLPDVMKAIKGLPDDPLGQKQFVDNIYQKNDQAQKVILTNHASAPEGQQQDDWSPDNHSNHMASLMQGYGGQRV